VLGESLTEQNTVANLAKLFAASKRAGITVAISPHYYYPYDHKWKFNVTAHPSHRIAGLVLSAVAMP
jgi:hypothetical protein